MVAQENVDVLKTSFHPFQGLPEPGHHIASIAPIRSAAPIPLIYATPEYFQFPGRVYVQSTEVVTEVSSEARVTGNLGKSYH